MNGIHLYNRLQLGLTYWGEPQWERMATPSRRIERTPLVCKTLAPVKSFVGTRAIPRKGVPIAANKRGAPALQECSHPLPLPPPPLRLLLPSTSPSPSPSSHLSFSLLLSLPSLLPLFTPPLPHTQNLASQQTAREQRLYMCM